MLSRVFLYSLGPGSLLQNAAVTHRKEGHEIGQCATEEQVVL